MAQTFAQLVKGISAVSAPANSLNIDSSGRVGIGTASPTLKLSVDGDTWFGNGAGVEIGRLFNDAGVLHLRASSNVTGLALGTNGAEKARIDSSGRVGIGTTSPGSFIGNVNLVVGSAATTTTTAGITLYSGTGTYGGLYFADGTSGSDSFRGYVEYKHDVDALAFGSSGNERARIDSSGRLLVGTSSSRQVNASIDALKLQIEGTTYQSSSMSLVTNQNAADGSYIILGKSRGASLNSSTIVNSGDSFGAFWFCGADGTDLKRGAVIEAQVDGTPGANDMPGKLVFSTTADGASSPTERVRITSNGYLKASNTGSYYSATSAFHEVISSLNAATLIVQNSSASLTNSVNGVYVYYSGATPNNTNASAFYFEDTGGIRASIRSNGGLANYQANNVNFSDRSAKKNITVADDTWGCVKQWEIVKYHYKDQLDDADLNMGVIAQQVAESCPEVITVFQEAKEATEDAPAQEERLGVKEQQMMWMAIKALQEAQLRIETLEAEVTALKGL